MPYAGDDAGELEARQEPRLVRALEMVAPGTAVREGLDGGARPPAAFGELGLTGELRQAAHADRRLAEAHKFGLSEVLHPSPSLTTLSAALTGVRAAKAA